MKDSLNNLREKINALDEQIIDLLSERMTIVSEIGKIKKTQNLPLKDTKQWTIVRQRVMQKAQAKNLNIIFIKKIYSIIHTYAINEEEKQ